MGLAPYPTASPEENHSPGPFPLAIFDHGPQGLHYRENVRENRPDQVLAQGVFGSSFKVSFRRVWILSSIPLIKAPESSVPNFLANSIASLRVALKGISGQYKSSNVARRRMLRSTAAMRFRDQFSEFSPRGRVNLVLAPPDAFNQLLAKFPGLGRWPEILPVEVQDLSGIPLAYLQLVKNLEGDLPRSPPDAHQKPF